MRAVRWILQAAENCKPVLIRIFPVRFLRRMKEKVLDKGSRELASEKCIPYMPGRYPKGVNLFGNIRAEMGLGQSCRLVAGELEHGREEFCIIHYPKTGEMRMQDYTWDGRIVKKPAYDINLLHVTPYELNLAHIRLSRTMWDYRYNIAFLLWELEEFPEEWVDSLRFADEIWTPSEFTSESIRRVFSKPVVTIPYCVTAEVEEGLKRAAFGLPEDKFLYLVMYDRNSTSARKNPEGAVKAYKLAFSQEREDVGLVIKINNAGEEDVAALKELTAGCRNIYYITDIMDKRAVNSLIRSADVFISLHRAEGFGLVMAEAMLLGTPVIATNWSSNTEFMNPDIACMVGYRFAEIEETAGAYQRGKRWAEPEIGEAAEYIRRLYSDREYYKKISEGAQKYIRAHLSMEKAASAVEGRLSEIRAAHGGAEAKKGGAK